ncbi:MAG TPA: glycosyltransferase [Kofleriaceae bacterium]|nr:glycosyltransferase [Kofleriaceae bacterium]
MARPALSIVIPTRNRPALAQVAVESVLAGMPADVEVVVADNSDAPTSIPSDPRVNVLPRLAQPITMTANWERALAATRGEWVTFMSDKHRIVPRLYMRVLELAIGARTRLATFDRACMYQDISPDAITATSLWESPGRLQAPSKPPTWTTRSTADTLTEWYRIIRGAPHRPQIYRGIVHRSVIESAMQRTGRFFFGTCPDYASGLQSMAEVSEYVSTNMPAVIVQIPTADITAWSPAQSLDRGGKLGNERMREVGAASFAKHNLPITVTSSILETLLEFRGMRPDVCATIPVDWQRYAWLASNEIENATYMSSVERLRNHALIARATQSDGLEARPLMTLARVVVSRRHPRMSAAYRRFMGMLGNDIEARDRGARDLRAVDSLHGARGELERMFADPRRAAS